MRTQKTEYPQNVAENYDEEAEGIQSKERWTYVKVNMDGVIVGRKVCILDHMGYPTLALQLEEMFGMLGKTSHPELSYCNFLSFFESCLFYREAVCIWSSAIPTCI